MEQILNKNKTIVVRSSPKNQQYQNLKAHLNNDAIKTGLKQRNLEILEDISGGAGDFSLYLYGQNGAMYLNESGFNSQTFDKVFNLVDSMTRKPSQSGGSRGSVDYQKKYYKYKHKCDELQKVVSSFQVYGGKR